MYIQCTCTSNHWLVFSKVLVWSPQITSPPTAGQPSSAAVFLCCHRQPAHLFTIGFLAESTPTSIFDSFRIISLDWSIALTQGSFSDTALEIQNGSSFEAIQLGLSSEPLHAWVSARENGQMTAIEKHLVFRMSQCLTQQRLGREEANVSDTPSVYSTVGDSNLSTAASVLLSLESGVDSAPANRSSLVLF